MDEDLELTSMQKFRRRFAIRVSPFSKALSSIVYPRDAVHEMIMKDMESSLQTLAAKTKRMAREDLEKELAS